MAISQFFWTGIPCIYYGDEVGIEGHTISDAGCRYPMPWGREKAEGKPYYDLYKKLIDMRKNEPALYEGGRKVLYVNDIDKDGKIQGDVDFINVKKIQNYISYII